MENGKRCCVDHRVYGDDEVLEVKRQAAWLSVTPTVATIMGFGFMCIASFEMDGFAPTAIPRIIVMVPSIVGAVIAFAVATMTYGRKREVLDGLTPCDLDALKDLLDMAQKNASVADVVSNAVRGGKTLRMRDYDWSTDMCASMLIDHDDLAESAAMNLKLARVITEERRC